jgi:hypothetical protein
MSSGIYLNEIVVEPNRNSASNKEVRSVVVAMIRNESDIIRSWVSHVLACFDKALLVDHQSTDGTFEFLTDLAARSGKLWLYRFDDPGYYQEEITNTAAHIAASSFPNAWIMPLDADEFVRTRSREEFHDSVSGIRLDDVISLSWRPCIPYSLRAESEFDVNMPCLISPTTSSYSKVGLHAQSVRVSGLQFCQGSHHLRLPDGSLLSQQRYVPIGEILHLPLRSMSQFVLKLVQGCIAYEALPTSRRDLGQGFHWFKLARAAADIGCVDEGHLRDAARHYGEPEYVGFQAASIYELIDSNWWCGSLPICFEPLETKMMLKTSQEETARKLLNDIRSSRERAVFEATLRLLQQPRSNKDSYCLSTNSIRFRALSRDCSRKRSVVSDVSDFDFLRTFIKPAFQPAENPVPSAWVEHIPFFFCLLNHVRPRRFVELGTHYGNSFFAACQVSRSLGSKMECIAIDTWKGDEHAGEYGEEVFKQFEFILNRDYTECGRFICNTFDNASQEFERGSIDLLHIDGLHTYEAVLRDFETWRPKLSECGVIMFHDTQVRDRGFGVWRLWEALSRQYYSFEFKHGYGLGLIYVGDGTDTVEAALFEKLGQTSVQLFLRDFFSRIGKLSPIKGYPIPEARF